MAEWIFNQPHFQDENEARDYLEALRWPNGRVCPHCGRVGNHYALTGESTRPGLYKCRDCRKQFSVTVGTVFERSKIKLHVWLQAVHRMCACQEGISAHQLHRELGVTYKTAWFMEHRIREAMKDDCGGLLDGGGGAVEADETIRGNNKKRGAPKKGRGYAHKVKGVSLLERGGSVRSVHVPNLTIKTLNAVPTRNIAPEAKLMTDEATPYRVIGEAFASHEVVSHSRREYSLGDAHTNTIEGLFSILKCGLIGTFHHVGEQHLHRYVREFDFRYDRRKVSDCERANSAFRGSLVSA